MNENTCTLEKEMRQALLEKLEQNYRDYTASLQDLTSEQLLDRTKEIYAAQVCCRLVQRRDDISLPQMRYLLSLDDPLAALRDTVGDLLHAVDQAAAHTLLEKDRALARLEQRLSAREPLSYVREMTLRTQHLKERLAAALDKRLTLLSGRLSQAQEHLRAVGPQAVLGRGYTIALRKGQAVASASQAGGDMTLIFRDGRANVRVQSVWEGDPFANEEGKANL